MTAIDIVLECGEYRQYRDFVSRLGIHQVSYQHDFEPCKRFLVRLLSRAIFDASMYPENNPNYRSAKDWLLGKVKGTITFKELVDLVGLNCLADDVLNLVSEESDGFHKSKIQQMKKLIYNLEGLDGSGRDSI